MKPFLFIVTLFSILLTTGGCRIKKSLRKEQQIVRLDSLHRMETEVRESIRERRQELRQQSRIRQIQFSAPDSLHRQYIQSVTITETGHVLTDSMTTRQQMIYQQAEEHIRQETTYQQEQQMFSCQPAILPMGCWISGILFIILIVRLLLKAYSKQEKST